MNKNQLNVVKEDNYKKPDIHEIEYLLVIIIKDCRNKYFYTFEYRLVYDIKFTKVYNIKEINFTIIHKPIEFKTEFCGLNRKIKNDRQMVLNLFKQRN